VFLVESCQFNDSAWISQYAGKQTGLFVFPVENTYSSPGVMNLRQVGVT
jgi:hypothetical protein